MFTNDETSVVVTPVTARGSRERATLVNFTALLRLVAMMRPVHQRVVRRRAYRTPRDRTPSRRVSH